MSNNTKGSGKERKTDILRVLGRLFAYMLILGAILFISAGRLDWVMGWLYMAMYTCMTVIALLVVPLDPELVEERTQIKEGVKEWDKRLTVVGSVLYPLAILVVAGLDARFGWSPQIPIALQLAALIFAVLGELISIWATSVNKFYGRFVRIQKERGHAVATGGPYQFVRHPSYVGTILSELATPIMLGSWWALIPGALDAILFVVRTALEDRTLQAELDGYKDYTACVHYRLLPGVW